MSTRSLADRFDSVGNHLAIDFVNTRVAPNSAGGSLRNTEDVLAFLVEHEALTPREAAVARKNLRDVGASARFMRRAIALRDVVARALEKIGLTRPLAYDDLLALNAVLKSDAGYSEIRASGASYSLAFRPLRSDATNVLAPVARAMAELLTAVSPPVRKCANAECIRWFYDDSRTGRRRWCEMAICGNRAKVSAFQRRQRRRSRK